MVGSLLEYAKTFAYWSAFSSPDFMLSGFGI